MSDLPSSVRIGCLTYRVLTSAAAINAASDAADLDPGSEWTAYCDHDQLVIGINGGNPREVQRRDLLHEVLHCCLRYSGVEPNAYARVVERAKGKHGGYSVEEFTVAATAAPLLDTIRRSPGLAEFLTAID